jgi:hypothetical protein
MLPTRTIDSSDVLPASWRNILEIAFLQKAFSVKAAATLKPSASAFPMFTSGTTKILWSLRHSGRGLPSDRMHYRDFYCSQMVSIAGITYGLVRARTGQRLLSLAFCNAAF